MSYRNASPTKPTSATKKASAGQARSGHAGTVAARLDPRRPFVVYTRELGRHPGLMRRVQYQAPAPADLRLELIGVPERSPIELDLRLEAVMEGVLVSGAVTAPLTGECGRCLGAVHGSITVDVQELFVYPEYELDDDEVSRLTGDLLDVEPVVRDAVVLALPLTPLCRVDCRGLCVDCGQPWETLPADHTHDRSDLRWAALRSLSIPTTATPAVGDQASSTDQEF